MKDEILKEYEERIDEHLKWFEIKAYQARRKYLYYRSLQTIILSTLPVLFIFPNFFNLNNFSFSLIGAVLSILALVITSLLQISNYDSQWQQYRLIAEQIKKERISFHMEVGEYSALEKEEQIKAYIERVESIIQSERSRWYVGETRGERI
mgnify:CR=1 FL=1